MFLNALVLSAAVARSGDGVPIRYEVRGEGEPALVLVHGWAFDRHVWDGHAPSLAERHRVVSLDLAGHGESGDRQNSTLEAFGADVVGVVEAVGATRVVLIGHSMGGPVVLEAARRMPRRVTGIVLVDTLLDVEQRASPQEVDAFASQFAADYRGTATKMATESLFVPRTPQAVRDRVLRHALALPSELSISLLRQVWTYDPLPALREIRAPIRAVSADMYPTNLDANRRHMPGYEAAIVAGSGHYPMLEDPAAFAAALDRALERVLAAKPSP